MKSVQISINTVDKVKAFVNDIKQFEYDFDLVSGRFVVDAKSIMGIFSLDLRKPICLNINTEDNTDAVLDVLSAYLIQNISKEQCNDSHTLLLFDGFAEL